MLSRRPLLQFAGAAFLGTVVFLTFSEARAAVLTWDGNGATAPNPNGGSGTWNTNSTANWWNGSTNVVWPATGTDNDASFADTAGTVTISGGVTANDLTFSTTGYIVQSSTLTLNGTTPTITTDPGVAANIISAIAGTAGLTKAGNGTLTLTGTAPLGYTGATNVSAGTLKVNLSSVGGTVAIGWASAVNIASTATLELNGSSNANADNAFFNSGSLAFTGSGTITKTGTGYLGMILTNGVKDFTGLIDIQQGILGNNGSGWAAGAGLMDLNIASGATFDMRTNSVKIDALTGGSTAKITSSHNQSLVLSVGNNNGTAAYDGTINNGSFAPISGGLNTGVISLTKVGSGTQTLNGVNTYTGATTINANGGTLQIGGAGSLGSGNYANTIAIGANSTLKYSSSANQTFSGNISGAGALVKDTSASTLTLSGDNSFSGGTTISAGTVKLDLSARSGGYGNVKNFNIGANGTLELSNTNTTIDNLLFTVFNPTGAGTINKTGAGYIDMAWSGGSGNINNFDGAIIVTAGTLGVNFGAQGSGKASLTVKSGAAFDIRAGSLVIDALSDGGGAGGTIGSSFTNVSLSLGNNGGGGTFSGVIQNTIPGGSGGATVALVKNGAGTQVLSGANTYSGTTTVNGGVLQIGAGGTTGTLGTAGVVLANNSSLVFNRSNAYTVANAISGAGAVAQIGGGTLTLSGDNSYSGGTSISAGTLKLDLSARSGSYANVKNFNIGANGTLELSNTNTGIDNIILSNFNPSGAGTINKTGAGYIDMSYALGSGNINSFTGVIVVTAGTLGVNKVGPAGSGNASLTVKSGGAFDIRTGSLLIDALGDGGGAGGVIGSSFTNVTLSLGNNNGGGTFSGVIQNTLPGGAGGATIALIKNGSGTQTLSGANTYSGTTTVNGGVLNISGTHAGNGAMNVNAGGTLLINGVKTGMGAITVANNATLGGHGTLSGAATIQSGGTLSPGASPGVITFNNSLTLQSGAEVYFEGNDLIVVNGLLTLPSTWVLDLTSNSTNWVYDASRWTVLFDYNTASLAGGWDAWSNILFPSLPFDTSLVTLVNDTASGEIRLMGMYAVPEPSCCLLAALGLVAIAGCARRRSR